MRRREAFTRDPEQQARAWEPAQAELAARVARAEGLVARVRVPDRLLRAIAQVVVRSGVASHRADVTILECAKALAALGGREEATREDVLEAAALALGHRLPADPFGPAPAVDAAALERLLEDALDAEPAEKKARAPAT
jgi:Mg-chelatase subunit ChlI